MVMLGVGLAPLRGIVLLTMLMAAGAAAAADLVVGPDGTPQVLAAALAAAHDGDTIELLPGQYRGAVDLVNRKLTLRGVGKVLVQGEPRNDGAVAAGEAAPAARALWTVRGGDVVIDNIEFRGARANDGGGAGVRQQGGKLTLRNCRFFDNEHGLLAVNDAAAEVVIERSVFGMAPKVVGGLYHLLNVGRIGKLTITGSRFQQGFEGHLIKTRARDNFIAYNFIHDGQRGGASYEVEIAAGGTATIIGNVIGQGADSQNPVVVAYGTEGTAWPVNRLLMAHNTLVTYGWLPAWFLRTFTERLPPMTEVLVINNLLVGPGVFWGGANGHFDGNRQVTRGMLRDIDTYGFELPPASMWRNAGVDPRNVGGHDLAPKAEFEWPVGTRALPLNRGAWTPGAYQR